ncbi:hypothetical protein [Chitinophaga sp. LS1]|uniref:hypothetical protein n=1 Tax=Chitinophaga sp. LS1 TaxID=3051176 RepID=UPI002AABEA24|nr:hypothetical protein [Chitinophaga sp. LS1]WPV66927.1 hypothetical protein QQL36_34610 [Chitinophaga sp. LS1]
MSTSDRRIIIATVNWFNEIADANPQIRRLVRYTKAWCDYREFARVDKKMPSGLVLTILVVNNFYSHDRDDIALKETMVNMEYTLSKNFSCGRPTPEQGENLLSSYTNKDYFMKCLSDFISNAKEALKESNGVNACAHWQKNFGDRFPCHLAKNETGNNTATVGLFTGASTNRPGGLKI